MFYKLMKCLDILKDNIEVEIMVGNCVWVFVEFFGGGDISVLRFFASKKKHVGFGIVTFTLSVQ